MTTLQGISNSREQVDKTVQDVEKSQEARIAADRRYHELRRLNAPHHNLVLAQVVRHHAEWHVDIEMSSLCLDEARVLRDWLIGLSLGAE